MTSGKRSRNKRTDVVLTINYVKTFFAFFSRESQSFFQPFFPEALMLFMAYDNCRHFLDEAISFYAITSSESSRSNAIKFGRNQSRHSMERENGEELLHFVRYPKFYDD